MPACYTEWKVNPHHGLEKHAENLWSVEGKMENGVLRRMTLAKFADGRIVVHNAIALEEPLMDEINAWGQVAAVLVPNSFHRMDCRIFRERYPSAKVYAPANALKSVGKATPVDGSYADAPGDATVQVRHLAGIKDSEGIITVQSADGATIVGNDMIMNTPAASGMVALFTGPTGQLRVPRFARWWWMNNKSALKADLEGLAATDGLVRVVPGHGPVVVADAAAKMKNELVALF